MPLIIRNVRCVRCQGKLELAGGGHVLICPACKLATRLPDAQIPSRVGVAEYDLIVKEAKRQGRKRLA